MYIGCKSSNQCYSYQTDVLCYALGRVGRVDLVEEIRDKENDYRRERAITTRGKHTDTHTLTQTYYRTLISFR